MTPSRISACPMICPAPICSPKNQAAARLSTMKLMPIKIGYVSDTGTCSSPLASNTRCTMKQTKLPINQGERRRLRSGIPTPETLACFNNKLPALELIPAAMTISHEVQCGVGIKGQATEGRRTQPSPVTVLIILGEDFYPFIHTAAPESGRA